MHLTSDCLIICRLTGGEAPCAPFGRTGRPREAGAGGRPLRGRRGFAPPAVRTFSGSIAPTARRSPLCARRAHRPAPRSGGRQPPALRAAGLRPHPLPAPFPGLSHLLRGEAQFASLTPAPSGRGGAPFGRPGASPPRHMSRSAPDTPPKNPKSPKEAQPCLIYPI